MEFSDQVLTSDDLPESNQSAADKENEPHPLTANQSCKLHQSLKHNSVEEPHPSFTAVVEQPHPSATPGHTRYYTVAKQYLAKNNNGCDLVSHDAWTLTCDYFDTVQPHPLLTTVDWSETISYENL